MTRIFITGSSTGLGALAAKELIALGHEVVLHARSNERAKEALNENPNASHIVIGDLSVKKEIISVAQQVNELGFFDVIIHNAGVNSSDSYTTATVNVEAPYILTSLINKPKRIIYVSSGMHKGSRLDIDHLENSLDYSGSKLALMLLMKAVSHLWTDVATNAIEPGWVPTRMGGKAANDDLVEGYTTQVWLATGTDIHALDSGNCYYHKQLTHYDERVDSIELQEKLINKLEELTQVVLEK